MNHQAHSVPMVGANRQVHSVAMVEQRLKGWEPKVPPEPKVRSVRMRSGSEPTKQTDRGPAK